MISDTCVCVQSVHVYRQDSAIHAMCNVDEFCLTCWEVVEYHDEK